VYSEEDLASAVTAGVLTDEAAEAFRTHVAQRQRSTAVDEEHFRLVTGFNDIFVVIACVLLLASLAGIGSSIATIVGAAAVAAAAWLLAEFFTRNRRMALPSIVLLLAFVGGVLATGFLLLPSQSPDGVAIASAVASAVAAAAAWLHWRRFHVPITIAAGSAAVVACAFALFLWVAPDARNWLNALSLIAGVTVFAIAMRWDATDTLRQTRRSDVAFWLHLLAAPLLVHPIFTVLGVSGGHADLGQALAVVALYVAIALVSLAVDRRALMVSALTYVLFAFSALLKQYGVVSLSFAITAFAIGAGLLLLSAFWHPTRAFVLGFLPPALQQRLAPFR
jgi:MFS family permease